MNATRQSHRLCIAPMMDHTDRHFRFFMRLLTKQAVLYTEMITTGALLHGDRARFLKYDPLEHPLAIQLGGSNPNDLVQCAQMAEQEGYDEVNLNIGCPSDRVQNGQFGACLMANAELVAECVSEINHRVQIPVTVKSRIGIDDQDDYAFLQRFVTLVSAAGCQTFIIHARKAILSGLSPRQNREIPPLNYPRVHAIKHEFPDLNIVINGGITTTEQVLEELQQVDGVMIGRAAYQNPYWLTLLDARLSQTNREAPSRETIFKQYCDYMLSQETLGIGVKSMSRHIIGLYQGQPGARKYRQILSAGHPKIVGNSAQLLDEALKSVSCVSL